jgi:lipoprotein-anchoring transpeptidase ErfK/SrfK
MFLVMRFLNVRLLPLVAMSLLGCDGLPAQPIVTTSAASSRIEPGLEQAVGWKWWVAPAGNKEWGMPLPDALKPKPPGDPASEPVKPPVERPEYYEVRKGDAVIKIAKKFEMTVWQLKQFNDLKDDNIRIGQILRIPTPEQVLTMIPPPPPPAPEPKKEIARKKKPDKAVVVPEQEPEIDPGGELQRELENVRVQVFLDREMYSPGMIDGKAGATFLKISGIYQRNHADAADPAMLKVKAEATVKEPYTRYILRVDDFKFIKSAIDQAVPLVGKKNPKSTGSAPAQAPVPVTIDSLVAADFLAYTSAWEFVAERFHCDEVFLHHINPQQKGVPVVGSEFQVPNVDPFEIEKALDPPLQPPAEPGKPVTAAVVLLSRLEISREGKTIAVMPLATARPGLHGRGSWTVLDAIPQPRMATKREPREVPKVIPPPAGVGVAIPTPGVDPPLEKEQYLGPGPNNPVGVIWINLAKTGSTDPLPYGLHGTSIPAKMASQQGIGGLRLSNWDIVRATRLMPPGTVLQWKAQ